MKSTARLMGHPIHPMLIPYPFAFLSAAAVFDVVAARRQDESLSRTARHLNVAGVGMALLAAVPGLIDYATVVPSGRAGSTATTHMVSNLAAVGCFAAAAATRGDGLPSRSVIALEIVGTALLSAGGWLGGNLVYHHQIGVSPEESHDQIGAGASAAMRMSD